MEKHGKQGRYTELMWSIFTNATESRFDTKGTNQKNY